MLAKLQHRLVLQFVQLRASLKLLSVGVSCVFDCWEIMMRITQAILITRIILYYIGFAKVYKLKSWFDFDKRWRSTAMHTHKISPKVLWTV